MSEEIKPDQDKVFVVMSVSRQILGDYVFVRAEKAYKQASKADACVRQMASALVGLDGRPMAVSVSTPQGQAQCYSEVSVFELAIEE